MSERVAITGMGIVCALGNTRDTVAAGARAGARPFGPVRRFDASGFRSRLAAEAPDPDAISRFGRRACRRTSRTDRLALCAAADALSQADLRPEALRNAGIFVGASSGGMAEMEAVRARDGRPSLGNYLSYPVAATASALGRVLGVGGPRATYMTACSSSAHALGQAMVALRCGELELALAGGSETLCRLTLAGFSSLGVLDPQGARPFCAQRGGITLGEGAAFFVLEPRTRALRRQAPILAEITGYGAADDAHHMVHPRDDGAGARLAIQRALADAAVEPTAIDFVSAHGTGTEQNDRVEAVVLAELLGASNNVRVASSKAMVGHTLGAAGAIEAGLTVLGMCSGFVPPNPGVADPMPELGPLRLIQKTEGEPPPRLALSTSFAFGGNNAALVLAAPELSQPGSTRRRRRLTREFKRRRVVITAGAVACPQGTANEAEGLMDLLQRPPTTTTGLAGLVPASVLGRGATRRMDTLSATATAVSTLALRSAGLNATEELGVGFGTGFGALDQTFNFLDRLFAKGARLVNPIDFPNLVHNAPAGHIAIRTGAMGPNLASCQEELAGDEAVAALARFISQGDIPAAIGCGGDLQSDNVDAAYATVDRVLHTRSKHASVVGAVVLEEASASAERGAQPWAWLLGVGRAGPWGGAPGAVGRALEAAQFVGSTPERIDLWFAGATEKLGRSQEGRAAQHPMVKRAQRVDVRAALGDAQGAGPAAWALAAAAVRTGRARTVLVSSVTRDGACHAALLGATP
jgi:3-oxoacyl-(acyl-carrier-protein) synthase